MALQNSDARKIGLLGKLSCEIYNFYSIKCINVSISLGKIMIVMEYAKHGNLLSYLKNKVAQQGYHYVKQEEEIRSSSAEQGVMGEMDLMSFAWQIAKGMNHLENMKV